MSFFEFPYTRTYSDDLGWLIRQLQWVTKEVQFKTIKYADPLAWDITSQYEQNTVVIDQNTGIAYLSTQPVPTGVSISNTDYWTVIFDLQQIIGQITSNLTFHNNGTSPTLLMDVVKGDWILWNNILYVALHDMYAGTALIIGSNIDPASVETLTKAYTDALSVIVGALADLTTSDTTSIVNAINSVLSDLTTVIGSLADLNTSDTTNIVNAINSVLSDLSTLIANLIGSLADLTTSDKTNIVNAINSLVSDVTSLSLEVGALADLTTSDKTSIVNAINSLVTNISTLSSEVGTLANLTTSDKTSIVNAINSLVTDLATERNARTTADNILNSRIDNIAMDIVNMVCIGDSYLASVNPNWATYLTGYMQSQTTYIDSEDGAGYARPGYTKFEDILDRIASNMSVSDRAKITHVVLGGGINDQWDDQATLLAAITSFWAKAHTHFPFAKCIWFFNWGSLEITKTLYDLVSLMAQYAIAQRVTVLDDIMYLLLSAGSYYINSDHVHPTSAGSMLMAFSIFSDLTGGHFDFLENQRPVNNANIKQDVTRNGKTITYRLYVDPSQGVPASGAYVGDFKAGHTSTTKRIGSWTCYDEQGQYTGVITATSNGCQLWYWPASNTSRKLYFEVTIPIIGAYY